MNTSKMNYDIKYISPAGSIKETIAQVTITMPIKERVDAQKFILELKNNAKLAESLLQRIDEINVELTEFSPTLGSIDKLKWELKQLQKFVDESNR